MKFEIENLALVFNENLKLKLKKIEERIIAEVSIAAGSPKKVGKSVSPFDRRVGSESV